MPSSQIASTSGTVSLHEILSEIGPLQPGNPRPESNRGQKSMASAIITSPELQAQMNELAVKKAAKQNKRPLQKLASKSLPPAKKTNTSSTRGKRRRVSTSSSSTFDKELCIVCGKNMPPKQTKTNSINCNTCKKAAHLKCANFPNSYCLNCDSEYCE